MIKYFRRLGLVRVTELALGLLVIATALLIITGGDVFESGRHINLAKLDEEDIKAGMYVEIENPVTNSDFIPRARRFAHKKIPPRSSCF